MYPWTSCHNRLARVLTGAHELGESGQEPLDANAAHIDELPRQEGLAVSRRDRCRKNHLEKACSRPGGINDSREWGGISLT